ncbi:LuxR C-terminal-related transcriptional regulator [Streptomyces sp. NPDC017405]|uniref:LuxR C-terminal-related transcriptional regulator n=1 Tax=unclassified Streptomyces TaxID=2593676 RepID=UPI0037B5DC2A
MDVIERGIRMLGRESDRKSMSALLASVAAGEGNSLLVVEGRAGVGKTTMLTELARLARGQGFCVESPAELAASAVFADDHSLPLAAPKLIVVDGVETADPAVITDLCHALAQLTGRDCLLALAVRPGRVSDRLHRTNPGHTVRVMRMQLGQLSKRDAMLLCAELSGARPSPELLGIVESAGGNPLMVTELVRGLLEEGGIEVFDGTAQLRSPALPERIQIVVRGYLSSLSPASRHMLRVAAVLNTALRPAQLSSLAAFLGKSTATLLPLLDEALEAGLLVDSEGKLVFPGALLRRVVAESVPWSMRQALLQEARAQHIAVGEPLAARPEPREESEELVGAHRAAASGVRTPRGDGLALAAPSAPFVPSIPSALSVSPGSPGSAGSSVGRTAETADDRLKASELTMRELEVLQCVAQAMSNRQVGRHLSITEGTVKRHMRNIFRKLDATSRIDAVNKVGPLISAGPRFRT